MDHAIAILLGLAIVLSLAGVAISYVVEFAQNIDDEYKIISNGVIYKNQDVSVIVLSWTNAGDSDVRLQSVTLIDSGASKIIEILTKPHQSNTTQWITFDIPENSVIQMNFVFADGFESPVQHRLE